MFPTPNPRNGLILSPVHQVTILQHCKIVTWRTGLKIRPLRGLGVGEHSLYHSSYTEVYGYLGPVVWPWFSCV